jgi:hypothetical protein
VLSRKQRYRVCSQIWCEAGERSCKALMRPNP